MKIALRIPGKKSGGRFQVLFNIRNVGQTQLAQGLLLFRPTEVRLGVDIVRNLKLGTL